MRFSRFNLFHLMILQLAFLSFVVSASVHAAKSTGGTAQVGRTPTPPGAATTPPATPAAQDAVSLKLQKALNGFLPSLGNLEPWQARLFQEEVLPGGARFVRDYRTHGNGLAVDVDSESIRNFLRFYGPKSLKREKAEVLLVLRPELSCELCLQSAPAIQKLVQQRLERRGLSVLTPKTEQVDPKLMGKPLDEQVARVATDGKLPVTLIVEWKKAQDDVDLAHADELRFSVRTSLVIRDVFRQDGSLEIFDTGSFDKTVGQLLTDLFTDLGARLDRAPVQVVDADKAGFQLELIGVRDFSHYTSLKNILWGNVAGTAGTGSDAGLAPGLIIEEQKLARGRATFVIYTQKTLEEVKALLSKVDLNASGASVQMEIR